MRQILPAQYPSKLGLYLESRPELHAGPGPDSLACAVADGVGIKLDWDPEAGTPPTPAAVEAWDPPTVTDVNSPIKAILTGYQESEAARVQRIALLKSSASYALGTKIAGDLAAANPPSNADELAALKAEAKSQASSLGGAFFDSYFAWIGAYREGGGPGFLAAVQADASTGFLNWPVPPNGITLPDGTIVLPEGGVIRDLFQYFLA